MDSRVPDPAGPSQPGGRRNQWSLRTTADLRILHQSLREEVDSLEQDIQQAWAACPKICRSQGRTEPLPRLLDPLPKTLEDFAGRINDARKCQLEVKQQWERLTTELWIRNFSKSKLDS